MARALSEGSTPITTSDLVKGIMGDSRGQKAAPQTAKAERRASSGNPLISLRMPEVYRKAITLRRAGVCGTRGGTNSEIVMEALDLYLRDELEFASKLDD